LGASPPAVLPISLSFFLETKGNKLFEFAVG